MGLGHSPIVVSEGLVFYFDPINTRSYAGTGLTGYNLINTSIVGTFTNGPAYDSANKGSVYFDGVDDYIDFGSSTTFKLIDNFTLSAWVKSTVYGDRAILGNFGPSTDYSGFNLNIQPSNKFAFLTGSAASATYLYSNDTFLLNKWYHLTAVRSNGTNYLYVNGVGQSSTNTQVVKYSNQNFYFGKWYSNLTGFYHNGHIASAALYNRALSSTEILQNYNATKKRFSPEENIVKNGLVYYFDAGNTNSYAGTGLTAYDIAGSGATNSLVNGPAFSTLNGGSIYFDGSDDHIVNNSRTTSSEFQYTSAFTIIAFCKIIENTNTGYIVNNRTTDGSSTLYTGWGVVQDQGTIVGFVGGYPGGNTLSWRRAGISTTSFNNLVYNKWAQVTFVNTGVAAGQKIYINAIDYTSYATDDTNPPYTVNYAGAHRIYIGQDGTGAGVHPMTANIAQVQIYNRALSSTEILQNYNASKGRYGLS